MGRALINPVVRNLTIPPLLPFSTCSRSQARTSHDEGVAAPLKTRSVMMPSPIVALPVVIDAAIVITAKAASAAAAGCAGVSLYADRTSRPVGAGPRKSGGKIKAKPSPDRMIPTMKQQQRTNFLISGRCLNIAETPPFGRALYNHRLPLVKFIVENLNVATYRAN